MRRLAECGRSAQVTAECCDEADEDCRGGYPHTCNAGCAAIFLPFWTECRSALGKDSQMFEPAVALCEAAEEGALLACGTNGQKNSDLFELVAAIGMAHGVCCEQLGEVCDGESERSLPSAADGATTCNSPVCARAIKLVADSCAPLLVAKEFALFAKPFQDVLDHATTACAVAAGDDTQRYAVTDSASTSIALTAVDAELTDGMGAGGHGGRPRRLRRRAGHRDAVPGDEVLLLILEMDAVARAARLAQGVGGRRRGHSAATGHDLPSLEELTFRSKPGGTIRVTMVQDPAKVAGTASLFSFAIPCEDAACGGHGSCGGGRCVCTGGYTCTGSRCENDPPCLGVECAAHGSCNAADGTCTCTDGYRGEQCSVGDGFVISGARESPLNGLYILQDRARLQRQAGLRTRRVGRLRALLAERVHDLVGRSQRPRPSCDATTVGRCSLPGGGVCPDSPDGGGCAGKWWEYDGIDTSVNPSLTVVASQGRQ